MEDGEMYREEEEDVVSCPRCEHVWNPNCGMSLEEWLENGLDHCYGLY